jgi:hypothetical protein
MPAAVRSNRTRSPWWVTPLCATSRRVIREAHQHAQQTGENAELAEHAAMIRRLGKRVVQDIIHIGQRLTKAKELVGHGGWEDWLREEFRWSADTALNFMRVYELSESRNFRDLLVAPSALYQLAQPRTPETVRDAVLARAAAGETITVATVRTELRTEQPAAPAVQARVASPTVPGAASDLENTRRWWSDFRRATQPLTDYKITPRFASVPLLRRVALPPLLSEMRAELEGALKTVHFLQSLSVRPQSD